MVGIAIFCAYFTLNFYPGASLVATEAEWKAFFCVEDAPAPAKMLDRRWQFTCESYWYPYNEHTSTPSYVTPRDRCFPKGHDQNEDQVDPH